MGKLIKLPGINGIMIVDLDKLEGSLLIVQFPNNIVELLLVVNVRRWDYLGDSAKYSIKGKFYSLTYQTFRPQGIPVKSIERVLDYE